MAFRFRKSFRIAPGVRVNLSRSGVSTTLGGRGLSVNVSRRGTRMTAGIPGTGLSYHARGGGASRGGSGRVGSTGREAEGCLGCGGAGFLLLLLVGLCGNPDPPGGTLLMGLADTTLTAPLPEEPRETFYLHGALNLRTGPGKAFDVARTLSRGERVTLGAKDAGGWAPLLTATASGRGTSIAPATWCARTLRRYRCLERRAIRPLRAPSAATAPTRTAAADGAPALARRGRAVALAAWMRSQASG